MTIPLDRVIEIIKKDADDLGDSTLSACMKFYLSNLILRLEKEAK